ncbi:MULTISPECIES: TniQ family protein [unclassified Shewanella]|uniref:TniQ family protein n=1 Tax=unclassified Shewanella TaxID=196818 RepID=UPI00354B2267
MRSIPVLTNVLLMPNEHVLGPLARQHLYSSYKRLKDSLRFITCDRKALRVSNIWRKAYEDVYRYWGDGQGLEKFAQQHTLINYYQPFLTQPLKEIISSSIEIRPPSSRVVGYTDNWRYCIECAVEDIEVNATPYFHIEHQIPGITHCSKHKLPLKTGCLGCGNEWFNLLKIIMPPFSGGCEVCSGKISTINSYQDEDTHWLQSVSLQLFKGDYSGIHLERLQEAYRKWIGIGPREGVLNLKERKIVRDAQKHLDNFFSVEFYRLFFANADLKSKQRRAPVLNLYEAAFHEGKFIHPLIHLVLIRCFFGSIENFIENEMYE